MDLSSLLFVARVGGRRAREGKSRLHIFPGIRGSQGRDTGLKSRLCFYPVSEKLDSYRSALGLLIEIIIFSQNVHTDMWKYTQKFHKDFWIFTLTFNTHLKFSH